MEIIDNIKNYDGYTRLLHRIFGRERLFCPRCGIIIEGKFRKKGDQLTLCLSCFRAKNVRGQHNAHPHAGSRRIMAQRAYPVPQTCQVEGCGEVGVRHHEDYDKPLEIIWLCPKHHYQWHGGFINGGHLTLCANIE